ncbi:MAG: ABC transporter ATP-binding protein [Desulfosarcinaceae bacterium]
MRSDVAAILFDEPLTVIDPHLKWDLRRKLKVIHEQLKLTFIYVTHDQVEALTVADQVVVMYEGEIVQIGSPEDLFENPEHTFVGYFIGSPGMNLLDCTLEGNMARFNGAGITLDEELAAKGNKAEGKLTLGIQPLYLEVHAGPVEGGVPAKVKTVEDLGSYKIVTAALNGETLRAKLPEGGPVPEDHAWLVFPPQWVRLFAGGYLVR